MPYNFFASTQRNISPQLRTKLLLSTSVWLLVILARITGALEFLELGLLDFSLKYRPAEEQDPNITLITINDNDINALDYETKYPIPDQEIADLIRNLQQYNPTVVGLDLFRDFPIGEGKNELQQVFKDYNNIVGIEKVLGQPIPAPLYISTAGFVDVLPDQDGNVRRVLLGTPTEGEYKFSFALHLVDAYLTQQNYKIGNSTNNPEAFCIYKGNNCLQSDVELPKFTKNKGGYSRADDGGLQMIVNFRSGNDPFRTISLSDFKSGKFSPEDINKKIIIIGVTSLANKDLLQTNAIRHSQIQGQIYGVKYIAHVVSQIINAVEFERPLVNALSQRSEYFFLVSFGLAMSGLILFKHPSFNHLSITFIAGIILSLIINFISLNTLGIWLPIFPVFLICGILSITYLVLSIYSFFHLNQILKETIEVKQLTIQEVFNYIHNGPLQTLAETMRSLEQHQVSQPETLERLKALDREMRNVRQFCKNELFFDKSSFLIAGDTKVDSDTSLDEIFNQIYQDTINRDFVNFENLKARVSSFESVNFESLSKLEKEQLCHFLEECICNAGRHAHGLTRLQVVGVVEDHYYSLKVQDNGAGISQVGIKQLKLKFQHLRRSLDAKLTIQKLEPKGTICQIRWQLNK